MGNNISFRLNKNLINNTKQGRWMLKNHKLTEINSYWNNIDNCGDSICGNAIKNKDFFNKEFLNNDKYKQKNK